MIPNEVGSSERAVSPVVGATLLVGITVILASVVGTVILGVGVGPAETPEVTLSFEVTDSDEIELRHEGGETLDAEDVVVVNETGAELDGLDGDLSAGERETIVGNASEVERVSVVWQAPRSDSERVLATFEP